MAGLVREYKYPFGFVVFLFLCSFLYLISFKTPVSTAIVDTKLISQSVINEDSLNVMHKSNTTGGLISKTSSTITFVVATKDNKSLSKTMEYTGDIEYIKGNENKIKYKEHKNIYGKAIRYSDIKITYDSGITQE